MSRSFFGRKWTEDCETPPYLLCEWGKEMGFTRKNKTNNALPGSVFDFRLICTNETVVFFRNLLFFALSLWPTLLLLVLIMKMVIKKCSQAVLHTGCGEGFKCLTCWRLSSLVVRKKSECYLLWVVMVTFLSNNWFWLDIHKKITPSTIPSLFSEQFAAVWVFFMFDGWILMDFFSFWCKRPYIYLLVEQTFRQFVWTPQV